MLWSSRANMRKTPNHCERRGASSQSKASFHSHRGLTNNAGSRELLSFVMGYWQKMFLLDLKLKTIMKQQGHIQPGRIALWRGISQSVQEIQTLNFNNICILVLRLSRKNWIFAIMSHLHPTFLLKNWPSGLRMADYKSSTKKLTFLYPGS